MKCSLQFSSVAQSYPTLCDPINCITPGLPVPSPLVSLIFLKTSLVFPILLFFLYFFALITEEGFLISPCYSLNSAFKWVYLSFSPLLFACLLFIAVCKASSYNHFAFSDFFFLEMILIVAACTMSWTAVHNSSATLSTRSNPLNLFITSTV